ncbi:MAG: sugar ABC transporter substrate-binding protein [Oscillospiraceae bacterium]|nr:sugar ABC transporter substrate-binding protein [Oscillospiraceae bacterium]
MKKRSVKILAILMSVLLMAGLLAACADETAAPPAGGGGNSDNSGSGGGGSNERIELVFSLWGDPAEQETTQRALDVYNDSQDKVYVKALQIGRDEYNEKLQTMATSGEMPDCGMVAEDTVIGWARDGLLSDFDIYAGQDNLPLDYITFKYEGKVVAYSAANEVLALWFNKQIFDDAGIPYPPATLDDAWTWDEFIEVARKLTIDSDGRNPGDDGFDKNNIVQYGAGINTYTWQLEVWALSNGGKFFSSDGKSVAMDDATIEAIQKVADLHLVENIAPFNDGTADAGFDLTIGRGNVAMGTDGQWATGFRAFVDIDYGVGVLPYMKHKANICTGGPTGIFATTDYPNEAADFLRWYNSEENNINTILDGWWMPTKMNWYTDEALLEQWIDGSDFRKPLGDAYRTAILDVALDFGVTKSTAWYYTPNTYEVLVGTLQPALVEAFQGGKTVKEVVDASRDAMQAALDKR